MVVGSSKIDPPKASVTVKNSLNVAIGPNCIRTWKSVNDSVKMRRRGKEQSGVTFMGSGLLFGFRWPFNVSLSNAITKLASTQANEGAGARFGKPEVGKRGRNAASPFCFLTKYPDPLPNSNVRYNQ